MSHVINLVFPLFSLVILGYFSGRYRRWQLYKLAPTEESETTLGGLWWINFFVLYISLPAMFFLLLARTPFHEFSNVQFLFSTTLATVLVFVIGFARAKLLARESVSVSAIQGFCGAYGNIGYLGPPLAIAAFGPEAGVPVALIFCVDNVVHFTLAPMLMAIDSADNADANHKRIAWFQIGKEVLLKIFSHPFILATAAGVLAAGFAWEPPAAVNQLLTLLAAAAAPCALFVMGVTAALRPLKRIPVELGFLIPLKLLVHPVLMYLCVSQVADLDAVWLYSAVLLAAVPTATNVFVIAQQYDTWVERASSAVVLSTLFSTVTVTLFLFLATNELI